MPRSQKTRKHCLIMSAGVAAVVVITLCLMGSQEVFSGKISDPGTDESTLELLHIVFRHGPRTPVDTYPLDPHFNETFYPVGWGHVTNNGKRELFNIGTWLRKRYGNFMRPYYHPDFVHAQATDSARTHMSLQTVLASFFPPKGTAMEWNSKYNWQPIPIYSQKLNEDTLLLVRTPCPRFYEAFEEVMASEEVKAEIEPHLYLYNELAELTGMPFKEPEDVQSLYLTLLAEQDFGLKLPDWTKQYFPDKLQFLTEQSYIYKAYTREMQKIKAGPFITKMLDEMQQKRNGTLTPAQRKLFIYTGHDSTLVNILSALNVWKRQLPRYSIMALFELHKDKATGEYWVEIYLRNNPKAPAEPLTIPGCDFKCPLDKLYQLTQDLIISNEDSKRCDARNPAFTEPPPSGP